MKIVNNHQSKMIITLLLLMLILSCIYPEQACTAEYTFIENKNSTFVKNTYNDEGKIIKSITMRTNNKYGKSYVHLNSCRNGQYITAINWNGQDGYNYLVSIRNNTKQVIYKSKETLLDYSISRDCDKVAFLTEVYNVKEKKINLNILSKGELMHSWPLDINNSWFLSKRAWLGTKDTILFTKFTASTDKKAYIVMKDVNTGEEKILDQGMNATVLQNDHGEEVIYYYNMEGSRRLIALDIGTMERRIIRAYPEDVIISGLDSMPDNQEIVFQTRKKPNKKQSPQPARTVILNLETMKETIIDLDNPDFVPANP